MKDEKTTLGEYYAFLKKEKDYLKEEINLNIKNLNEILSLCNVIIGKKGRNSLLVDEIKIYKTIKSDKGMLKFKNILMCIFGKRFFEDLTKKEQIKYKEEGLFTKYQLNDLLGHLYGEEYGYKFNEPKNFDELTLFFANCVNIIFDTSINSNVKVKYVRLINSIKNEIVKAYKSTQDEIKLEKEFIKVYDLYIEAYKKGKPVDLSKKADIREILKNDKRYFKITEVYNDDGNLKIGDEISFCEAFIMYCKSFNDELYNMENEKQDNKIGSKVDKIYKKINRIPFEKLENKNLPKYSSKNYNIIMEKLLKKYSEDIQNNPSLLDYYTVLLMYHASSFNKKYIDDNNKLFKLSK